MKKYLVINGVNLNMLGIREPGIYGNSTLDDLENNIRKKADELGVEVDFFQSNFEGEIVEKIHSAMGNYNGIIINPGAFTHYSYAIRDAFGSLIPSIFKFTPFITRYFFNISQSSRIIMFLFLS